MEPEPRARQGADDVSQLWAGREPAAGRDHPRACGASDNREVECERIGEGAGEGDAGVRSEYGGEQCRRLTKAFSRQDTAIQKERSVRHKPLALLSL